METQSVRFVVHSEEKKNVFWLYCMITKSRLQIYVHGNHPGDKSDVSHNTHDLVEAHAEPGVLIKCTGLGKG